MDKPSGILPGALDQFQIKEAEKPSKQGELGQSEFFELMITQLNNQDPFKPMESGEFLGQIAQFSTVNGIDELKASFSSLATSLQSSQALQASTMVGRSVVVPADQFEFVPDRPAQLIADIPSPATNVRITITDTLGAVVSEQSLGQRDTGRLQYAFNGINADGEPIPAGEYKVRIDAVINGEEQALQPAIGARVDSVSLPRDGDEPILNVDGFGSVAMSDVLEII